MKRYVKQVAVLMTALMAALASHAQVRYNFVDLGEHVIEGQAINNMGTIAAQQYNGSLALIHPNRRTVELGAASVVDMNEAGSLTGQRRDGEQSGAYWYSRESGFQMLEGLFLPESAGINDDGQIAGHYVVVTDDVHARAFLYTPGTGAVDLGTLGGPGAVAFGLNNRAQVTGTAQRAPEENGYPFVWSSETGMVALPTELTGAGHAINDHGQVAGIVRDPEPGVSTRAFLYTPGVGLQLVGFPGVTPNAINVHGQFVGTQITFDEHFSNAVFYSTESGMIDLNQAIDPALPQAGWLLARAYDINDRGHITGLGFFNGSARGFMLIPVR